MMYNVCVATRESHALLLKEYDLQRNKRGKSNESMESDAVIVPRIPGNAGGGKDGTQAGSAQGNIHYTQG